jgi:hypothetical protein
MRLTRRKPVALCVLSLSFVLLLSAKPSQATISRVHSTAGQITAGSGSITVPSTTAGNLLVVQVALFNGTPQVSSVTDGGDTFVLATNSRPSDGQVEIWYCLNTAGGKTSVTVTANSSVTMDVAVNEYQAPGATWSFDIANSQTRQSATTTPTSPTLTTTGANDVVVALITSPAAVTSCVANLGQTFNLVNTFDGEGYLDLLNVSAGTYQAKCNLSASQIYESDIAAFTATAGGGSGITLVQHASKTGGTGATISRAHFTAAQITAGSGTITIPSTTAGNLLVVQLAIFNGSTTVSSITDGGDTFVSSGARPSDGVVETWHCLSTAGGKTSVTVTLSASQTADVIIYEYQSTGSTWVLDTVNVQSTQAATTTPTSPTLTTTGANDVVMSVSTGPGGVTGTSANLGQTFNNVSNQDGEGWADLLNVGPGTYQAKWTQSPSSLYHSDIVSFKAIGTTNSSTLAFPSNNTAGNWIGVAIRAGASTQVFTVTDSKGNTYHKALQLAETLDSSQGIALAIYYAENIASGANTVTVSDTVTGQTLQFAILEYSGVATSNSLDVTASAQGNSTAPNSGSATTTTNGDLVLGGILTANSRTYTAGSGLTIREAVSAAPSTTLVAEDRVLTTAGSTAASASLSSSDFWGAVLATFKAASGGGGSAPTVTGFTPTSGPSGTSVTITGTNFTGATGVKFNGIAAASYTVTSSTQIAATVSSTATTGPISVTTPSGTGTSTGSFTPTPTTSSTSPISGPVLSLVTISGANFGSSTPTVKFGSTTAGVQTWNVTTIVVQVPNTLALGLFNIQVTTSAGSSNTVPFMVVTPGCGP